MRPNFPSVKPGQPLSARQENDIRDFLNSLLRLLNQGGLDGAMVCGSMLLRKPKMPTDVFPAQLTAATLDTSTFTVSTTATTTSGNATLTSVSDTSHFQVGMVLTGTGIATGATITSITSTTIVMSANATASGTVTVTGALYLYDWNAKLYDPTYGSIVDYTDGPSGTAATNPAVEVNNQLLGGLPTYVWMRQRTSPNGKVMYEFYAGAVPTTESYSECLAVATSNVASLSGTTTIDGVSLAAGDRVLLVAQSTASQNGPWIVASGAWTRPPEYGAAASISPGFFATVAAGTLGAGTTWVLGGTSTVTVDTTSTTWATESLFHGSNCRAAADSNISSLSGTTTIDGVSLVAGDKVLLTGQTSPSQNGPWVVQSGAWIRPPEYLNGSTIRAGYKAAVSSGTKYAGTDWINVASGSSFVVGSDTTTWNALTSSSTNGAVSINDQFLGQGLKWVQQLVNIPGGGLSPNSVSHTLAAGGSFSAVNNLSDGGNGWTLVVQGADAPISSKPVLAILNNTYDALFSNLYNVSLNSQVVIDAGNVSGGGYALFANGTIGIQQGNGQARFQTFNLDQSAYTYMSPNDVTFYASDGLGNNFTGSISLCSPTVQTVYGNVLALGPGYHSPSVNNDPRFGIYSAAGGVTVGVYGTLADGSSVTGGIVTSIGGVTFVTSVTAADTSITIGGTSSAPTVGVNYGPGLHLDSGTGKLVPLTDGSTLGINGSNQLYIPNAGVGDAQISSSAMDGTTLSGGSGSPLQIKNGGVGAPQLASTIDLN